MDHFAAKLKELRAAAGLTQQALADKAAVPLGTLRDLERGRRKPMFETAAKLAAALGVATSAFEPKKGK